jgi:hypothetical protein
VKDNVRKGLFGISRQIFQNELNPELLGKNYGEGAWARKPGICKSVLFCYDLRNWKNTGAGL